ncbi:2-phosphosulfolactate phosphatase [Brevibacillus choshinensis]|uniref:Probable 2-phosphosulfolactate phosphatase n=1 Tax=Brevibacillus choshinensis TaxID=54911 RepID=A0ABX7FX71_BRECH|nr:2-phosphosulfolactate phosphatase [Brevibacillus choshinensis]QRG70386.1 2-phosphosulfolactate phosphatase [Brevibacillus choshinensis]
MISADVFTQSDFSARFEWGYEGVEYVGNASDIVVIVDVLSFTTCVDVVVGRGGVVFPYRFKDDTAQSFAMENNAIVAGKRGEPISHSPATLRAIPLHTRIVLPSPNGSTCTVLAKRGGGTVIAACLRNASAVARYINRHGGSVTMIASGERWPNGALRPAIEDMIAAGSILDQLTSHHLSPEAKTAVASYRMAKNALLPTLAQSGSGQELISKGYVEDVHVAAAYDSSECVPILGEQMGYTAC